MQTMLVEGSNIISCKYMHNYLDGFFNMKQFSLKKADVLLLLFIITFCFSNTVGKQFRHLFYILPVFAFLLVVKPLMLIRQLWNPKNTQSLVLKHFLVLNLGVILYSAILLLFRQDIFIHFFEESVFIISPIVFVCCFWQVCDQKHVSHYAKMVFWGITISYLLTIHEGLIHLFQQEDFVENWFLFSYLPTEHFSSFLFGLCGLYFLQKKDWLYYLLAVLLTIVSFKRIAIGALLFSSIVWLIIPWLKNLWKRKVLIYALLIALHVLFVGLMLVLSSFKYEKEIIQVTNFSTQGLSSGRMKTFTAVLEEVDGFSFWGYGLGKSNQVLDQKQHYLSLMHSDIMKLAVELGIVGGIFWLCFFYWPFLQQPKLLLFPIYLNFLFFTDNTFIYFEVLVLFYFFIILSMTNNEGVSTTEK